MEELLEKLYTDPNSPAGYSGVEQLYKEAKKHVPKITKRQVIEFLEGSRTYTLHKPRRLRFKRAGVHCSGYMTHCHADLGDFQALARSNKENRYLLVAMDVLSHTIFTAPTKSKTAKDMKIAFDKIFDEMPMIPHQLFTDRGMEFESREMKQYFREKGVIKHCAQSSRIKAALAERCIRTIKTRLYRYFSEKQTLNWIDAVPKIVNAINHSVCRTTGLRPVDINFKNAQDV